MDQLNFAENLYLLLVNYAVNPVKWLCSRNFFGGRGNPFLCKFLLLFYCFRTKFQGGAKVYGGGGQTASGWRPLPPVEVSKAQAVSEVQMAKLTAANQKLIIL